MSFELSADNELYYRLEGLETVDVDAYEMLRHNDARYLLVPQLSQLDDDRTLSYETAGKIPASEYLANNVVNTQDLISILAGANEAFVEAREYMLEPSSFAGSWYYLYIDEDMNVQLVYVPILGYVGCVGPCEFLRDLFVHMRYDMSTGDRNTLLAIHDALSQREDEFSPLRFRKLMSSLHLGRRTGVYLINRAATHDEGADGAVEGVGQAAGERPAAVVAPIQASQSLPQTDAPTSQSPGGRVVHKVALAGAGATLASGRQAAENEGDLMRSVQPGAQRGSEALGHQAGSRSSALSNAAASIMSNEDMSADVTTMGVGRFDGMAIPGPAAAAAGMTRPSGGIEQDDDDSKSKKEQSAAKSTDAKKAGRSARLFGRGRKGTNKEVVEAAAPEAGEKASDANETSSPRRRLVGRRNQKERSAEAPNDATPNDSKRNGRRARKAAREAAVTEQAGANAGTVVPTISVPSDAPAAKGSHGFLPYAVSAIVAAAIVAGLFYLIATSPEPAYTVQNLISRTPIVLFTAFGLLLITGIVRIVVTYGLVRDVSIASASDGKGNAPNIVLFVLLGLLSLGIYTIVQRVRVAARVKANAAGFGLNFGFFGGAFVLVCELLGVFTLGLGTIVGMFFLVRNGDALIGAYNALRTE